MTSVIQSILCILFAFGLLVVVVPACLSANAWVFHQVYPETYDYFEANISERFCCASGLIISKGVLVTDQNENIIVSPGVFWKAQPNHRYQFKITYNYSVFAPSLFGDKSNGVITDAVCMDCGGSP